MERRFRLNLHHGQRVEVLRLHRENFTLFDFLNLLFDF